MSATGNDVACGTGKPPPGRWLRALPYVGFLVVLASIWAPEVWHFYVRVPPIDQNTVSESRRVPSQPILDELGKIRTLHPWRGAVASDRAIAEGDAVLRGEYVTAGATRVTFRWPFAPQDLDRGPAEWALDVAAFGIPDRLLKAYDASGNVKYLENAVNFALQWDEFEASQWLPRGLAWNDHAVAERAYVLTDLWRAYRASAGYDPARGERILRLTSRAAELLARPSHFTFATNHGVMQNLALMQVTLAMPLLPDAARYFATGKERLARQLAYYISPEGVILEHSAGYHGFGMQLLAVARRYFEIAGEPPPSALVAAIDKGAHFTTELTRPGGSLPLIGDTHAILPRGEAVSRDAAQISYGAAASGTQLPPPESCLVLPTSGYAVWWNGLDRWPALQDLSQLVAVWSYFPGHGHKHADELSILFWAAGQDWVSNVGYWAYDHPDRADAESWQGSNAPHAMGESAQVARESVLKGAACGDGLAALDMERATQEGLRVRRQVVQASPSIWLVLDSAQDARGRSLITDWTFFPGLELKPGSAANSFRATPSHGDPVLDLIFAGSEGLRIQPVRGSSTPFAGWVYADSGPVPAPGLIIEQAKSPSWTAMIWTLQGDASTAILKSAPTIAWRNAESWDLVLVLPTSPLQIVRDQAKIRIGGHQELVLVEPAAHAAAERAQIEAAFEATRDAFPKYRDLMPYRYRATYVVLALFLLQVGVLLAPWQKLRIHAVQLQWTMTLGWVLLGLWLNFYYFAR